MISRKASVRFIFATICLDSLGIGLLIPVLPEVIRRFNSDPGFVHQYFGYFISVYALMQFVASPVLGGLSDKYGRRPVLLVSLLGAALDYLLMGFAPNLVLLFVGRVISGLTGASMTVASSYMADVSDDSNRSSNFGMIGAAFGIGFIVGPALGGLLGEFGAKVPFVAAAVLNLANFAFGYFVLPESLPPELRRNVSAKQMNPLRSLAKIVKPSPIFVLVWVYFLVFFAGQVHPSVWTLYTQHKFQWTAKDVGISLSFVGVCIAVGQGWLTRIMIPKLGESRSVVFGLFFNMLGFALFAIAPKGWMMYPIMALIPLSGIAGPALQSMISKNVPPQEQGELQGSLMALASLTAIAAPLFYTSLFARFSDPNVPGYFPGISYFVAAVICVVSVGLVFLRPADIRPEAPSNIEPLENR